MVALRRALLLRLLHRIIIESDEFTAVFVFVIDGVVAFSDTPIKMW